MHGQSAKASILLGGVVGLVLAAYGCGQSDPSPEPTYEPEASAGDETRGDDSRQGMQIEGTLGTIPARRVEDAMSVKLPAFQRCFMTGMGEIESLAGAIELSFRVDHSGSVEWVYPFASSIGHRATEQCVLAIAQKTRFPKPEGGDAAELRWGFEIEGQDGVRSPLSWSGSHVVQTLSEHQAKLRACAGAEEPATLRVTAYVAPGGVLLGAGAAADSRAGAEQIDCVLEQVRGFTWPDPGSYPAKVSFELTL